MQPLLLAFILLFQAAPQDTTTLDTTVESATVYLSGAEVQRSASLTLQPGTNHIAFTGLSSSLNEQTIQFRTNRAVVLESISKTIKEGASAADEAEIERLENRQEAIRDSINRKQAALTVLERKLNVLQANQDLNGESSTLTATELEEAVNYFGSVFEDIENRRIDINSELQQLNKQLQQVSRQLNELQARQRRSSGVIEMTVQSDNRQQAAFRLSYFVPNARWNPSYDVRVEDINAPLNLTYNANISQNTGVDWQNVQLTVSSAEPRRSATIPSLNPSYLQFYAPPRRQSKAFGQESQARFDVKNLRPVGEAGISQVTGTILDAQTGEPIVGANVYVPQIGSGASTDKNGRYRISLQPNARTLRITYVGYESQTIPITSSNINVALQQAQMALDDVVVTGAGQPVRSELQQGQTAFRFNIENPYTIPSGAPAKAVAVQAHSLPAEYQYIAIPKKQETAYLTAKVSDWESLNLLPGEASLFLDNSYVGKTNLNLNTVEDTLSFSLGSDEGIVIEREQIESFREKNFFGNKVTETRGWDITVRNTKQSEIAVRIIDQVPVSTNEDIEVELKERSGATYNESTGRLQWNLKIEPGEAKKLQLEYAITYPSGKQLQETSN